MTWRPALLVLVVLVAASCGGSGGHPTPSPESFATVKEIVGALRTGGVRCVSLHEERDLIASDAGQCTVDGDTVVLDIYASPQDQEQALEVAKQLLDTGSVVVGPNWTAGTRSGKVAARIQGVLGGELQAL